MKEKQIVEIGFKLSKYYTHDQYHTKRYTKGPLEIELTYEGSVLRNCDLTILEINCMAINFDTLKILTEILGDIE